MSDDSNAKAEQDEITAFVAGLQVHIRGLSALQSSAIKRPDVVFLLHGRLGNAASVFELGTAILSANRGILIVTFDQRNHGHRIVSAKANLAWDDGNDMHAQDMFSIQYGTSRDVSLLIDFLPMFLSSNPEFRFNRVLCAGVSLGGHSTYHVLSDDDRVRAGVVIIGCPDTEALMKMRAGGKDLEKRLPQLFLDLVQRLKPQLSKISQKDLLILKGDEDKLVPWEASQNFVDRLPGDKATVVGYPGIGHAVPAAMMNDAAYWIQEWRRKH